MATITYANCTTVPLFPVVSLTRPACAKLRIAAADSSGFPNFVELHMKRGKRGAGLHLFAFDLLPMNGREVCAEPLGRELIKQRLQSTR